MRRKKITNAKWNVKLSSIVDVVNEFISANTTLTPTTQALQINSATGNKYHPLTPMFVNLIQNNQFTPSNNQ